MFVHESALNLQSNGDRSVGARLAPDCVDKRQNSLYYDCDDGRKRRSTHKINIERYSMEMCDKQRRPFADPTFNVHCCVVQRLTFPSSSLGTRVRGVVVNEKLHEWK